MQTHWSLFSAILLCAFLPGVLAVYMRARRDQRLYTKGGWVRAEDRPVAFKIHMIAFVIMILFIAAMAIGCFIIAARKG
jgi:hypothetical protein